MRSGIATAAPAKVGAAYRSFCASESLGSLEITARSMRGAGALGKAISPAEALERGARRLVLGLDRERALQRLLRARDVARALRRERDPIESQRLVVARARGVVGPTGFGVGLL